MMRYKIASVFVLLALLSGAVAADYVRATGSMYNKPQRQYPTSACVMVAASAGSPTCYRDGVNACRAVNSAKCFADCSVKVRSTCIDSVRQASCQLPAGWEHQFHSRAACMTDAAKECDRACVFANTKPECRRTAYTRCSYIGRIFV